MAPLKRIDRSRTVSLRGRIGGFNEVRNPVTDRVLDGFDLWTACGQIGDDWQATIGIKRTGTGNQPYYRGVGLFKSSNAAEEHANKVLAQVSGVTSNLVLLFPPDVS